MPNTPPATRFRGRNRTPKRAAISTVAMMAIRARMPAIRYALAALVSLDKVEQKQAATVTDLEERIYRAFLQFEPSLVLYPPTILVFFALGIAEVVTGLLGMSR
jgi:hypothetical protein